MTMPLILPVPPTKETPPITQAVTFVVQAGVGGVGLNTGGLDEALNAVHAARQGVDHDGGQEDVDARDVGGFGVGAHRKHVLAEGGLVPDEPHDRHQDDGIQDVEGNCHALAVAGGDAEEGAGDEVLVGIAQAGQGLAVVAVEHVEFQDQAVDDELGGQGDDEGVKAELGHKEAVDQAHDAAHQDDQQDDQGDGQTSCCPNRWPGAGRRRWLR